MNTNVIIVQLDKGVLQDASSFRQLAAALNTLDNSQTNMLVVGQEIEGSIPLLKGIVEDHQNQIIEVALEKLQLLQEKHYDLAGELFTNNHPVLDELNDHFVTIEWDLEEPKHENIAYAYDQTIAVGSLLGTLLLSAYLNENGIGNLWLDARDVILADDVFGDASVLEEATVNRIKKQLKTSLIGNKTVVTQAILGGTTENYSIMMGQNEGVSRSVLAMQAHLDVQQVFVWDGADLKEKVHQ